MICNKCGKSYSRYVVHTKVFEYGVLVEEHTITADPMCRDCLLEDIEAFNKEHAPDSNVEIVSSEDASIINLN